MKPKWQFMVVDRESGREEKEDGEDVEDPGDDYWEKRYTPVASNIPSFLQPHANVILRTGKYLNVIRQSGKRRVE